VIWVVGGCAGLLALVVVEADRERRRERRRLAALEVARLQARYRRLGRQLQVASTLIAVQLVPALRAMTKAFADYAAAFARLEDTIRKEAP
jgi:hypothetical protein